MKQVYFKLLSVLMVVALLSCEKESEFIKPNYSEQGLSVHEARLYFESAIPSQHTTVN
ncbi:hypothetical protein [Pontibacter sp. H249]|uniref:hypothetical protein n=1 Tax=Pontibacter sp. H249 TaxID=3133420 RepID=UPI0030BC3D63